MKTVLICCLVVVDAFDVLNILQAMKWHSVTSFMLLQNGLKFRLVTGCDTTAGFTSRRTSQNTVFTDHSVKLAQIVTSSGFATSDIFMDRSSGLCVLLFFPVRNTSSGKVHGLARAQRMAKDT